MPPTRNSLVALVLAGGKGTRISELHPGIPKPTVTVAGRPFLFHVLAHLGSQGIRRIVVSTGFNASVLKKRMRSNIPPGIELMYVEETEPLGTGGGAIHSARAYAATAHAGDCERFLVLNGDSIFGGDWLEAVARTPAGCGAIVSRHVADVSRYGALSFTGDVLSGFDEKGRLGEGWINAGIYLIPKAWLEELPASTPLSLETDVIPGWLARGRMVCAVRHSGPFLDIGTPESLREADRFIVSNFS